MTKPRIVGLLSGKGGSGKTTVAISMCKLLADMGVQVLLLDFDLATNGSSYFFKDKFRSNSIGIWDLLGRGVPLSVDLVEDLPIKISEQFWFVPSRVALKSKGTSYDSFKFEKEYLKEKVLTPLIEWAARKQFSYVFIDCQAGFSISSAAAAEISGMAIFVTEADAISSDAVDNLLIQMGDSLPEMRRYLVNKIDVRDAETYRNMSNVFQSLNRLPPLPFDFSVRNAFGARQIPVDVAKPSPLLFALFETTKFAFPELYEVVEKYSTQKVDALFEKYDQEIESLVARKKELEDEQAGAKNSDLRRRYRLIEQLVLFSASGGIVAIIMIVLTDYFFRSVRELSSTWFFVNENRTVLLIAYIVSIMLLYVWIVVRKQLRASYQNQLRETEISQELRAVAEQLDRYRSMLWAKSKDYLVDVKVAESSLSSRERLTPAKPPS